MNASDLEIVERQIKNAKSFKDLFGSETEAKNNYRRLKSMTHEDRYPDPLLKKKAHKLFMKVDAFWKKAEVRIENGTYDIKIPKVKEPDAVWQQKTNPFYRKNSQGGKTTRSFTVKFSDGRKMETDTFPNFENLEEILKQMGFGQRMVW